MSLLCSLLPPSSSSSSSLLLPPPTRPSLPLPSSSSCYLCFLCFIFSVFFPSRSCTFCRLSCSFCISFTPPFVFLRLARFAAIFFLLYHLIFLTPLPPHSASYIIFSPNTSPPPSLLLPLHLSILPFSFPWFKFFSSSFLLCLLLRSAVSSRPPLHALFLSSRLSYSSPWLYFSFSLHCLFPYFARLPSIMELRIMDPALTFLLYFTLILSLSNSLFLFQSSLLSILSTSFSFTSATFGLPVFPAVLPLSTFPSLIFLPPSPRFFRHPPPAFSLPHLSATSLPFSSSLHPLVFPRHFLSLPTAPPLPPLPPPFLSLLLLQSKKRENYYTSLAMREKRAINRCVQVLKVYKPKNNIILSISS